MFLFFSVYCVNYVAGWLEPDSQQQCTAELNQPAGHTHVRTCPISQHFQWRLHRQRLCLQSYCSRGPARRSPLSPNPSPDQPRRRRHTWLISEIIWSWNGWKWIHLECTMYIIIVCQLQYCTGCDITGTFRYNGSCDVVSVSRNITALLLCQSFNIPLSSDVNFCHTAVQVWQHIAGRCVLVFCCSELLNVGCFYF